MRSGAEGRNRQQTPQQARHTAHLPSSIASNHTPGTVLDCAVQLAAGPSTSFNKFNKLADHDAVPGQLSEPRKAELELSSPHKGAGPRRG